ncbi:hypothetical protein B5X24_HaOG210554 [Helicoverpa armigera]|uniref:C2H2-type domain-containing protein n=1 Tax=Helicoverpa armigera TaxID=29058 RepID=A0A2W1BBY8_HELAM|nr:hypothetical protein B5X24_HaOG210554 [Helicoverpa armigera]
MSTHERTEECEICQAKFHTKSQLKNHTKQAHSKRKLVPETTTHKCEICGRYFKKAFSLRMHSKVHMEKAAPQCPLCGLKFNNKNYLARHMSTHERTEECEICQAKFHTKSQLKNHTKQAHSKRKLVPETATKPAHNRETNQTSSADGENTQSDNDLKTTEEPPFLYNQYENLKREDLNHSTQCAIVSKMHKGRSVSDVCRLYKLTPEIVNEIWEDREKYALPKKVGKRTTRYMNSVLDTRIVDWFHTQRANDVQVSGRIKKLAGKKYIQGYVKDRLSVFLCANMPGTDKKKLLVCGTEDPLLHSFRNPDTLPVTYIRHSQAHFTTQMFEEYVKFWNRELKLKNRKAILVLDRATIHSKLQLSHLKLVFVPWKASNGLIPMKNGVSAKFREEFRRLILEEKAINVLRGVDRNLTCLEALSMLEKAWERTPPEAITKSFIDTGYDVSVPETVSSIDKPKVYENDEEILANMLKDYDVESYFTNLSNLDQYLTVDEELVTGQGTNGSVFGGNHKVTDVINGAEKEKEDLMPLATDKPESDEKEVLVKKSRALQDLDIVRKYLQSNATSYDTFCCFMEIEKFVMQTVIG